MKLLPQFIYEIFNKTIVNNVAFGSFQIALSLPYIIWNMVTSYSEWQCFFRQPEVRKNIIMFIVF